MRGLLEGIAERAEVTIGRLDQMLYPYYEKDLRENRITRQQAAELLGCLAENERMKTWSRLSATGLLPKPAAERDHLRP